MSEKQGRRDAIRAYKEREEIGGLYRIVNTATGDATPLMATPNMAGQRNRFEFGKTTGACFDSSVQDQWNQYGPSAFEFVEVERLKRKPEQSVAEFRDELQALLTLWAEGEEGKR